MNAIMGMTSLLLDENLTVEQKDLMEIIRTCGDALMHLVNDILDFSKMESKKAVLEEQPFEIRDVVEESLDLVAADARKKGLNLGYEIEKEVPDVVIGDSTRLRQILGNLLSNAVKFTKSGEVSLTVSARRIELNHETQEIHFAVQDTGIGIPQDFMDHLFQPYSQSDASIARNYGGTGLGLAISKKLVELMDGKIWVESEVCIGSTFHFTVNAIAAPIESTKLEVLKANFSGPLAQMPARQKNNSGSGICPLRILLAEDNFASQKVMLQMLARLGYRADLAVSGKEALRALENQQYDLVLMDVRMPEMDGLEATRIIRQRWPEKKLKIIAVTALAMQGDKEKCLAAGMDGYIAKPLKIEDLASQLRRIWPQDEA